MNWMKFILCSVKIPKVISPETVNFLSATIYNLCFRCRANRFPMKSLIFTNIPFRLHQNLHLHSNVISFNRKVGTFCSILLWNVAVLYRKIYTMDTDFLPAMVPMLISPVILLMKALLSMKVKKVIMQSTSMLFPFLLLVSI